MLRMALLAAMLVGGCATIGRPRPHPLSRGLDAWNERSIAAVAHYVAKRTADPWQRIRALHDWVVRNVAYDVAALELPRVPLEDGDAEWVFANRRGVCAGYASLLAALGRAAGLDILVVDGRLVKGDPGYALGWREHAWNVVDLDGEWYAIDATWDAGSVEQGRFHARYSTRYFLRPPDTLHALSYQSLAEMSLARLPTLLDRVWQDPTLHDQRLSIVREIRDDTAPANDLELGGAGERARAIIDTWLRAHDATAAR
jgi:hypothetical protein